MTDKTKHIIAKRNGITRKFSKTHWDSIGKNKRGWVEKKDAPTPPEYIAPVKADEAELEQSIDELRSAYAEKFDKNVPNNKKNDIDWILSKLND